ncbi:MAG: tetratricopeptide repeat protein [Planctomycetes bacterium]|nr:tetratricopeptide repeat protein [Planctomycetota bacterium]
MKFVVPVLCSLVLSAFAFVPREEDVVARFAELAKQKDVAATVELWKANPGAALGTIDEYLEGSLAAVEQAALEKKPVDAAAIDNMHATAIFGALAADQAFGTTIFADYASAFSGFDAKQQKAFRRGQAAHGEARKALKAGKHADALKLATECRDLAQPLGDWWGTAMGLGAMGAAYAGLGKQAEALDVHAQAAQIYHDLRLFGNEYQETAAVAKLCDALGRKPRAKVAAGRALELAQLVGDESGAKDLEALVAKLGKP